MSSEITFASLGLAEPLLRAVHEAGYTHPTPIQAQAIPQVLAGGDLLAAAQTGTGKTAGFTLPVLHRLSTQHASAKPGRPRCLILTPTRELAAQVEESVQTYGKHVPLHSMVMFGGVGINPQIQALKKRVDILVATPGRLLDHVSQKTLDLTGIEILVLDEADRMLDMGFIRDIRKILALLPKQRQNLLFSATFSDEIRTLADGLLHNPRSVEVARRNTTTELVTQRVALIGQKQKKLLLAQLIKQNDWHQVLVFTRTKHSANRLAEFLDGQGIAAAAIHGNKSQGARTRALSDFKDGSMPVLVATDIAARGLDIDQLPHVVNFELPNVPEDYVHRIGRTGRAGSTGEALSLVDAEEVKLLTAIERLIKRPIERIKVEGFSASDPAGQSTAPEERRSQPRPARKDSGRSAEPRRQRSGQTADAATKTPAKAAEPRRQAQGEQRKRQGEPRQNAAKPAGAKAQALRRAAPQRAQSAPRHAAPSSDTPAATPSASVQGEKKRGGFFSGLFSRKSS